MSIGWMDSKLLILTLEQGPYETTTLELFYEDSC